MFATVRNISLHCFFLLQQSDYKVINKDQWCNVLEFCRTVKSDLSNYDVDGACKWKYRFGKELLFNEYCLI